MGAAAMVWLSLDGGPEGAVATEGPKRALQRRKTGANRGVRGPGGGTSPPPAERAILGSKSGFVRL